jgi:IS30 family transposase
LVENSNKWIRDFIPKKTNLSLLSDEYIDKIEKWLNNRPKLVLNGWTAYEVFYFEKYNVNISSSLIDLPEKFVRR